MGNWKDKFKKADRPTSVYLEWSGGSGNFSYWDKEKNERIEPDTKRLAWAYLVERYGVRGWNARTNDKIFSNEIGNLSNDVINVLTFQDGTTKLLVSGKWNEIKEKVKALGGKFAVFLYGYNPFTDRIEHITLSGSALGAWIEFRRKNFRKFGENFIVFKGAEKEKSGRVEYYLPKFGLAPIKKAETFDRIEAANAQVEEFFRAYDQAQAELNDFGKETDNPDVEPDEPQAFNPSDRLGERDDDLPF